VIRKSKSIPLIHKKSQGCKKINRRLLFKGWRKMGNNMENRQNNIAETFQLFIGDKEMLAKVIECFPYPIEIYAPDGTSVMVNKAMLSEYKISNPDVIVGK